MSPVRVGLIVTGTSESLGFADALQRLWPAQHATFRALEHHEDESKRCYEAFTTSRVSLDALQRLRRELEVDGDPFPIAHVDRLVQAMFYHLEGRPRRDSLDYVVVIDDLELANRGNESSVLAVVRDAFVHVAAGARWAAPQRALFRERASLHLLDPMLEAYFYPSRPSLEAIRRDVATMPEPRVRSASCERFSVDPAHPTFFETPGECARKRRPKDRRCPWHATEGQSLAEHPKRYLQFLCRAEEPNQFCTDYQETVHGEAALRALDWKSVLDAGAPYLQALVEDLTDMIGVPPAIEGSRPPSTAPTALATTPTARAACVLRNV